jgi:hypothetical protein
MSSTESTYDRQRLYDEVWAEPVDTVAKRYGVSNVYLGRICRRLGVPVPGRGYWARRVAGSHAPPRPPLSPEPASARVAAADQSDASEKTGGRATDAARTARAPLSDSRALHPVALRARDVYRRREPDHEGFIHFRRADAFPLRVSRACLDRAVRLVDLLARAAEERGWAFDVAGRGASVRDHVIPCGVRELGRQSSPAKPRAASAAAWDDQGARVVRPSGELVYVIDGPGYAERVMRETKGHRLEGRVGDMLDALAEVADKRDASRRAYEEATRTQREDEARRERERAEREEFLRRVRRLTRQIEARDLATRARSLAADLDPRVEQVSDEAKRVALREWVEWVRRFADWADPVTNLAAVEPAFDMAWLTDRDRVA